MNYSNRQAILYVRVSTDEQADRGYSLQDQEERLRKFCDMMHIQVSAIFSDDCSAKTFQRPGWKEMLQFSRKNKSVNLLLFTNWSRFSRAENMGETYMMIEQLHRIGVEPQAIEQQLDLSIPENRLVLAFYIASPMVENLRRASNTANGIRRSLKNGRWCNQAPYGFRNGRDESNKPLLKVDPLPAAIIQDIFLSYHEGADPKIIIARARERGMRVHGHSTFERIITNPLYAGLVRVPLWKDEPEQVIKGIHEAIVPEDLYYAVNHQWRKATAPKPRVYDSMMELRGILRCDECGNFLTGGRSRGHTGRHWHYYRCLKCRGQNFRAEKIHLEMINVLTAISLSTDQVDALITEVDREAKDMLRNSRAEVEALRREIGGLETRMASMEQKYIDNKLDFDTYQRLYPFYRGEIAQRRVRLSSLESVNSGGIDLYRSALPKLLDIGGLYQMCDIPTRHELLNLIFCDGLFRTSTGYRTPGLCPIFSFKATTGKGLIVTGTTADSKKIGEKVVGSEYGNLIEPLLRFILRVA